MLQYGHQTEQTGLGQPFLLGRHEAAEEDSQHPGLNDGGRVGAGAVAVAAANRGEDVDHVGLNGGGGGG